MVVIQLATRALVNSTAMKSISLWRSSARNRDAQRNGSEPLDAHSNSVCSCAGRMAAARWVVIGRLLKRRHSPNHRYLGDPRRYCYLGDTGRRRALPSPASAFGAPNSNRGKQLNSSENSLRNERDKLLAKARLWRNFFAAASAAVAVQVVFMLGSPGALVMTGVLIIPLLIGLALTQRRLKHIQADSAES